MVTIVTLRDWCHSDGMASTPSFGLQLRHVRRRNGVSQAALARALSVDRSLVSRWESGEREPGYSEVVLAAQVLGIPVSLLVEGLAELPGGPEIVWRELAARGAPLLSATSRPLWALRPLRDTLADALLHPDPRVLDYLPALLLTQSEGPRSLWGACADWGVERRLGWVADIAVGLASSSPAPGGRPAGRLAQEVRDLCTRPAADADLDSLGFPAEDPTRLPPVFRRWRISYDGDLGRFEEAAGELATQGGR